MLLSFCPCSLPDWSACSTDFFLRRDLLRCCDRDRSCAFPRSDLLRRRHFFDLPLLRDFDLWLDGLRDVAADVAVDLFDASLWPLDAEMPADPFDVSLWPLLSSLLRSLLLGCLLGQAEEVFDSSGCCAQLLRGFASCAATLVSSVSLVASCAATLVLHLLSSVAASSLFLFAAPTSWEIWSLSSGGTSLTRCRQLDDVDLSPSSPMSAVSGTPRLTAICKSAWAQSCLCAYSWRTL